MRWLKRLPTALTGAIVGMSILLILILTGSVGLGWYPAEHPVSPFALLIGAYGAGLAWPLSALIVLAMLGLLAVAGVHAPLRTRRRGSALLLGATALHAAWLFGVRPPTSRTGVFHGQLVYGHYGFRPDYLSHCEDPTRPLPRGSDLVKGAMEPGLPVMMAVHVPEDGWHGSHPRDWPDTQSNSHGTRYWLVRVRGRLTGPGQYGRPGLMQYRLDVDSVLRVSPTDTYHDHCGVYDGPAAPREQAP